MSHSRPFRLGGQAALLLALASGCQLFCRDRPVTVLAKDAETGRSLPDAGVKITYTHTGAPLGPSDAAATTGQDGIAHLSASPADETGVMVLVEAPGYLPEEKFLSTTAIKALEPAPLLFGSRQDGQPTLTLALYAGPRPSVEFVVPSGYRGVIHAEVQAQEDAPVTPGQRVFSAAVPASGEVRITGPVLLKRIGSQDFTAKYADGTPIPRVVKDSEVGLWWLGPDGERYSFLVGTKSEFNAMRKPSWGSGSWGDAGNKGSQGGRGGGRRGGGRRGGGGGQSY